MQHPFEHPLSNVAQCILISVISVCTSFLALVSDPSKSLVKTPFHHQSSPLLRGNWLRLGNIGCRLQIRYVPCYQGFVKVNGSPCVLSLGILEGSTDPSRIERHIISWKKIEEIRPNHEQVPTTHVGKLRIFCGALVDIPVVSFRHPTEILRDLPTAELDESLDHDVEYELVPCGLRIDLLTLDRG